MSDTSIDRKLPPGVGGGLAPRPAPAGTVGVVAWLRESLFSSVLNTALTIASLAILVWLVPGIVEWAFINAQFIAVDNNGDGAIDRRDCAAAIASGAIGEGACWMIVHVRWDQLFFGFYASDGSLWRPTIAFALLFLAVAPLLFDQVPFRKALLMFAIAYTFVALWLLSGGRWGLHSVVFFYGLMLAVVPIVFDKMRGRDVLLYWTKAFPFIGLYLIVWGWPLNQVEMSPFPASLALVTTHKWGGLLLTLVIGVVGIALSLPIGIVLALGRRSMMPAVRLMCVIFIEFVRGVPLITLLFMASNMLPLFFPEGIDLDKLVRALIVVVAFSAAYMAEVVRGGLQAIPKGQYEAADAMGLSYWKSMFLIILPQALKIVIPGIVNSFIGLFKDTTLVLIIGLLDILGMAKAAVTHANWIGLAREAYVFVGVVYFIFCFSMSRYSIWLEQKLETGHKR